MYKFIICILDELKEVINRKWEFIRCEKKKPGVCFVGALPFCPLLNYFFSFSTVCCTINLH
jgi:hypothetical protein